jgi:hypothetical protein
MMRKLLSAGLAFVGLLAVVNLAAADPDPGAPCPDACGEKVCRPKVEKKTVVKRVYDDSCEDYCYPKCPRFSLLGHLFGGGCCEDACGDGCGEGGCAKCGCVRTKKYLVVKQCKHDECVTKCVVEQVAPACAAPCQPCPPPPCYALPPGTVMPAPQGGAAPMPLPK